MLGLEHGMVLNFSFQNWGQVCAATPADREFCIRAIAVHEFGHAIGFAHEQNRPDTPGDCLDPPQGGNGNVLLTPWDPNSVMNYCNKVYGGGGNLSEFDIYAVQVMYGAP
jgi:Astacin (Peptidase family M12A)